VNGHAVVDRRTSCLWWDFAIDRTTEQIRENDRPQRSICPAVGR
jgi:hypothetical protein